jgi:hypothetical protein
MINDSDFKITIKEMLMGRIEWSDLDKDIQDNLITLRERINKIREAYKKPMTVSSGLRSMADHLRIYKEKGITDTAKIPMKSKHLFGQAVDIYDPTNSLQEWCLNNEKILEEAQLWMEDFSATKNWCHFQISPPKSGKRWFLP